MSKTKKVIFIIFLIMIILSIFIMVCGILYYNNVTNNIDISKNSLLLLQNETKLYDVNNDEISSISTINRKMINIDDVPEILKNAFISIEDKEFYSHNGINYKRIIGAMISNIKAGSFVQGASTITQQLAKNTHLSSDKTIERKLKEIALAKKIESTYSKDEILEMYLNAIYFGSGCYGVASASQYYFDKSLNELDIAECATLAGIIKSPATYSPIYHPDKCIERRNLVLNEMLKDGVISNEQYSIAISKPIIASTNEVITPYNLYYRYVISEVCSILDIDDKEIGSMGLKIATYFDQDIQDCLIDTIENEDYYIENANGIVADSLGIVIDNNTFGVNAIAGRSQYDLVNFNRQPGSAIKPILVYSPALENNVIGIDTQILDEEIDYDGYKPQNVGGYHGYVSASYSVAKSLNIPAIKIMKMTGIDKCKEMAKDCGVTFDEKDTGLAIALGGFTNGITLQELCNTYLPYSNQGYYSPSHFVRRIEAKNGMVIYDDSINSKTKIMGDDTAFLMTDMLIEGVQNGTSKRLASLPYQVAGKTGTVAIPHTNNNTDAISIAYTTKHTMGVWMGNYDGKNNSYLPSNVNGGTMPTSVIKDVFSNVYSNNHPSDFAIPDSVSKVEIDTLSLDRNHEVRLATDITPDRYKKETYVANRYYPSATTSLYNTCDYSSFRVENKGTSNYIYFEPQDYLDYKIIKKYPNGQEYMLKLIQNTSSTIEIADNDISPNTRYEYVLQYYNLVDNNWHDATFVNIITQKEEKIFDNIIQNQNKENKDIASQDNLFAWYY